MVRPSNQQRLNTHFAAEQADLQTRVRVLEDAFIAVERTLDDLLAHLGALGHLGAETELVRRWRAAIEALRADGLPSRPMPGEAPRPAVTCPGCNALLRNVSGAPGERCDWCGHVFVLMCPVCEQELPGLTGGPGETCPWCLHDF